MQQTDAKSLVRLHPNCSAESSCQNYENESASVKFVSRECSLLWCLVVTAIIIAQCIQVEI